MRELNENLFKGCIKRKISFTASTFVKFLITGTVAISLTACGGGGGGGGSSSSGGNNMIIKFPGVDNIIARELIENNNIIFDKNIEINNVDFNNAGLKVSENSDVTINNSGKIEISGEKGITGVVVFGNSKVVNKGTIKVSSDYLHESKTEDLPIDVAVKYMSKGMLITDNSIGINEGTIEIEGSTTGILAYGKGSTGINKGTIKIVGDTLGSTWEEAPVIGMVSLVGGKVVNEGNISGSIYGQMGMFSYQGELVNNGTIQLSENDSYGMVVQEGYIENGENGKIILSHGTGRDPNHYYSTANEAMEVSSGKAVNKGKIEINNEYIYTNYDYPNMDFDDIADIGMYGSDGAEIINEKTGVINISGSTLGMMIDGEYGGNNKAVNNGVINIASNEIPVDADNLIPSVGMAVEDSGIIENNYLITGNSTSVVAMGSMNSGKGENIVTNNGVIQLSGSDLHGMQNLVGNGNMTNNQLIELKGSGLYGMQGVGKLTNNGTIKLNIEKIDENNYFSVGMDIWEADATNNGKIIIDNKIGTYVEGVAIDEDGGKFTNKGLIEINGGYGAGIDIYTDETNRSSTAINEVGGVITVISSSNNEGNEMFGMIADGSKASVINKGIINVEGKNSWGMVALGGAKAENYGTINVGSEASGGMQADGIGSTISNKGTINISKDNKLAEALKVMNGGTILNKGTINTNADIKVEASGTYVIGTDRDGSYGRISARNVNLDGNIMVEADIVRGDYKKEHILENIVEAEDIKLGEDVKFESNSLLYNASAEKDVFGNLDAKLERNSNNISDFTDKKFVNISSIFDDYINNEEEYNKLSSVEKDVVDTIFDYSTSENSLKSAVNQVTGTEYLNIQRQIFDIKNSFRKFDSSLISTLDNHDFNFQFIGEYSDISSKNGISGYESKMTGFNGAVKLSENLYGVLGYGYSDIDYDGNSDGKIQTIHTGIYKDSIVQEYNLRTGVYGEYNFHENNRAIFDKNAESDFNSYLVGVSGEVSKKYGKELYIQPSLSLDIAYGNIESFNESKADGFNLKVDEENYTSVLPEIKVDLGREFTNFKVFTSLGYSYEFGDMDKDMTIELLNKKADVKNNEMEHGQFDISVGGSLNINDLSLNAEIGKEFGRRDREYVKAGFSYTF